MTALAPRQDEPAVASRVGLKPPAERAALARTIVESALDCIVVMDDRGRIVEFNPAAEEAFGYSRAEAMGLHVADLMPQNVRSAHRKGLVRYLDSGQARLLDQRFETTALRKDGTEFPVELTVTRIPGPGPVSFVGFLRDLTDSKRTQRKLQDSTIQLRQAMAERLRLLRRLVAAHEEERSRIAEAIHDDSIQAVAALAIRVSALRRKVDDPALQLALSGIEDSVSEAVTRLRHLMFELHPVALEQAGLAATVQAHLSQVAGDGGAKVGLENRLTREPPPGLGLAVYRIIQEAVTNARKHARARKITVQLSDGSGELVARIVDDGDGFEVDRVDSPAGHMGLSSMRERAEMANGRITVQSAPGGGTTVEVGVPYEADVETA